MDSRGAATLLEDPTGGWQDLADLAGMPVPHIVRAREHTRTELGRVREILGGADIADDLSICLFGSWARDELTPASDDDWTVLTLQPFTAYDRRVVSAVAAAQSCLGGGDRAPGSQEIFGVPFDLKGLIDHVGLDDDTNTNLTRRMLLLLESCEVAGAVHADARLTVLERYMNYGVKDFRPPRFLLNDLTRYWRTICVDFEGKHADSGDGDPKWVTRNAKLRVSRKLLFAGAILPILLCHLLERVEMTPFLNRWLSAVPLDRLASAFLWASAPSEGARALRAYDRWLAILLDPAARLELRSLRYDVRRHSTLFQEVEDIGAQFERAILALLFNTRLAPLAQQYLVF